MMWIGKEVIWKSFSWMDHNTFYSKKYIGKTFQFHKKISFNRKATSKFQSYSHEIYMGKLRMEFSFQDNNQKISDCNGTRTDNHLVLKQTLNHLTKLANLAKWLSFHLRTKWLWVQVLLQSLKHQISQLFWARISLKFWQL